MKCNIELMGQVLHYQYEIIGNWHTNRRTPETSERKPLTTGMIQNERKKKNKNEYNKIHHKNKIEITVKVLVASLTCKFVTPVNSVFF